VSDELETALRYRSHAEELRAIAADMLDPNNRETILKIASDYDRMASSMEAIDRTYQTMRKA
jgi:predicted kinase